MALPQIYSRRKRQAQSNGADVYQYDTVPSRLRVQMAQLVSDGLGEYYDKYGNYSATAFIYRHIVNLLRREVAVHELVRHCRHEGMELLRWIEAAPSVDEWLDAVEFSIRAIDKIVRDDWGTFSGTVRAKPEALIEELNGRFREEGFGFQYVDGDIIRVDAEIVHREIVLPVLRLLQADRFRSADQEYRGAHDAYRHGHFEESLAGCGKALESVLKVIGADRGWPIKETDTTSKLVRAASDSGFLAPFHQTSLNHLVGLIESSTPTIRNKMAGHGAGTEERVIPRHLAAYQLHQTAAVILFLVEQDRAGGG